MDATSLDVYYRLLNRPDLFQDCEPSESINHRMAEFENSTRRGQIGLWFGWREEHRITELTLAQQKELYRRGYSIRRDQVGYYIYVMEKSRRFLVVGTTQRTMAERISGKLVDRVLTGFSFRHGDDRGLKPWDSFIAAFEEEPLSVLPYDPKHVVRDCLVKVKTHLESIGELPWFFQGYSQADGAWANLYYYAVGEEKEGILESSRGGNGNAG